MGDLLSVAQLVKDRAVISTQASCHYALTCFQTITALGVAGGGRRGVGLEREKRGCQGKSMSLLSKLEKKNHR